MITRNKHAAGRLNNIGFGLCEVVDGLIRVFTLGFYNTSLVSWQTKSATEKAINNMRKQYAMSEETKAEAKRLIERGKQLRKKIYVES